MRPRLPLLIRLCLGAHRASFQLERFTRELLDAVAWSWTPPARRHEVTSAVYARQPTYLRDGEVFGRGLMAWEREGLAHPQWPRSGRLLLGGAGGGRELLALAAQGYVVHAFEPLPRFAAACAAECRRLPSASCLGGSYADLVEAVRSGRGPLSALVAQAPFDGVLLGWGSLAHVTEPVQLEELVAAARSLAPRGPIFTSFYTGETVGAASGRMKGMGRALGRLFTELGAPGRRPEGGVFHPSAGFVMTHSVEEVTGLAARHGYLLAALQGTGVQPWVLLVPAGRGAASADAGARTGPVGPPS